MLFKSVLVFIFMFIDVYASPVDRSNEKSTYKIDRKVQNDGSKSAINVKQLSDTLNDSDIVDAQTSTAIGPITNNDKTTKNPDVYTTIKPGPLSWFLTPLTQNIQFSPQSFLQDRIVQLKEALNNFGLQIRDDIKSKQSGAANGLLQIVGVNDAGFYTNRLEPAGFFGGNGWLANKGGILGGPGSILSTGSILTDYPTPYKKK